MTEPHIGYIACYTCSAAIALSAILLNGLFLIALIVDKSLHAPSNAVLACLCFSDLLVGVLTLPMWTALIIVYSVPSNDETGLGWLKIFGSMGGAMANLSFLFITLVNLDRYTAILHPFRYVKHATCKLWIVLSLCFGVGLLLLMTATHFIDRELSIGSDFIFNVLFYCSAAFVIIFCNWKICRVIQSQRRSIAAISGQSEGRQHWLNCNINRYHMVAALVLILVLCKIPYIVFFLHKRFYKGGSHSVRGSLGICSDLGMILNSLLNPLIYYIRAKSFRSAMEKVLCCR